MRAKTIYILALVVSFSKQNFIFWQKPLFYLFCVTSKQYLKLLLIINNSVVGMAALVLVLSSVSAQSNYRVKSNQTLLCLIALIW